MIFYMGGPSTPSLRDCAQGLDGNGRGGTKEGKRGAGKPFDSSSRILC